MRRTLARRMCHAFALVAVSYGVINQLEPRNNGRALLFLLQNVLRELEQKKPQLDELVHTAENLRADTNRQQLHGKGECLRISRSRNSLIRDNFNHM